MSRSTIGRRLVSVIAVSLLAMLVDRVPAATPTAHEVAKLLASDGAELDLFGASVAVDGDTAVIGAYSDENTTGAAYVFVRSGGVWSEQQKLTASDGTAEDVFGIAGAIDGDTIFIGASENDDLGEASGSVYVFVRNAGAWIEQQQLMMMPRITREA
jgi:hypothetical protein